MKIIHTSDLHIDSPLTTRLTSEKIKERKAELFLTLSSMLAEGARLGAKAIIIAGDLFDTSRITKSSRLRLLGLIEEYREIAFFYLPGNHELGALTEGVEVLPKNLFVFGEDWTYFALDDTVVAGRQGTSADMFGSLRLPADKKNIVVLHGELREVSDAEGGIGRRDARGKNIDYLALGHYHSHSEERIDTRGVAVYSGTPEGRGFDETGEKGFCVIDTEKVGVSYRFVRFAKRTLHIVRVDISEANSGYETERLVERACEDISSSDLVRVMLVGKHPFGVLPDVSAISMRFRDRFYYFEMQNESTLAVSKEDYQNDRSLKGEFIRLVMSEATLSDAQKEKIIDCGLKALLGESDI